MRRINVIGSTGSGKSCFARALAQHLSLEYIQLDQLHWKADWVESSSEELFVKLEQKLLAESWILDGNYSKTNAIKWRDVDTIIWLDYSFPRTFGRLLRRTLTRVLTRQELWPGTGNVETWRGTFLSSDSILIWLLRTYSKNRRSYGVLQLSPKYRHIRVIRLRSPAQTNAFLKEVQVRNSVCGSDGNP